nr:MAG TPA: hypothetical protein [Caudoviricetes sp.]
MKNSKQRTRIYRSVSIAGEAVRLQVTAPAYPPECRLLIDTENRVCILNDKELNEVESFDLHIGPDGNYFNLTYLTDAYLTTDPPFAKGDRFDYTLHTTK